MFALLPSLPCALLPAHLHKVKKTADEYNCAHVNVQMYTLGQKQGRKNTQYTVIIISNTREPMLTAGRRLLITENINRSYVVRTAPCGSLLSAARFMYHVPLKSPACAQYRSQMYSFIRWFYCII